MLKHDDQVDEVQQATDLVRLIGEHVSLRPRGKEYVGLCPFHEDQNPSMYVAPAKQIYKCFSCGAGGNAFTFVKNYHKMTFPEALRFLADRAGITLRQSGRGNPEAAGQRQRTMGANDEALKFFKRCLADPNLGGAAQAYVKQRGISPEMVEQFGLGYAPDGWEHFAGHVRAAGLGLEDFELAKLIMPRQTGHGHFDFFRHRLIFPIFDELGRPIAFGGRKLRAEDEPKYLNSGDTPAFKKSSTLYGLFQAKQAIIASRSAIIVEGYTDVIACHQAGVKNAVAALGTAFTREHVSALRRFAEQVYFIFDADEAGYKAADRAVEIVLGEELDVRVATVPGGKDPDELFARPDGMALWQQMLENSVDALTYQFERMKSTFEAADTLTGREHVTEAYLRRIAQLGINRVGVLRRALVMQRLAKLLHLQEDQIEQLLARLASSSRPVVRHDAPPRDPAPREAIPGDDAALAASELDAGIAEAEAHGFSGVDAPGEQAGPMLSPAQRRGLDAARRQIIGALLREPGLFHQTLDDGRAFDEAVTPTLFGDGEIGRLYQWVYQALCQGGQLSVASLLSRLAEAGHDDLATLATSIDQEIESQHEQAERLGRRSAQRLLGQLQEQAFRQLPAALEAVEDPHEAVRMVVEGTAILRERPSALRINRRRL